MPLDGRVSILLKLIFLFSKGFKIFMSANWKQATSVQEDGWTSEILIPWSIAPMKSVSTEEREIGICFYRLII